MASWALLTLLPRLLLHHTPHGGDAGARELKRRVALFDAGAWDVLLSTSRTQAERQANAAARRRQQPHPPQPEQMEEQRRIAKAMELVHAGELSHAARALSSPGMAPGTAETLAELRNPQLRPQHPRIPLPTGLEQFQPAQRIALDRHIFGTVLRTSRKGLSSGMWGGRYEFFKLCLENDTSFEALCEVAELLAQGRIPRRIADSLRISALTALSKPDNRVRGIAAADTLRRLVAKSLARQFQGIMRGAVAPHNFGISDRSGTDAAIHMLQYLTDALPAKVIVSVDGVGAFDNISKACIFQSLLQHPALHGHIPFVR